MIKQKIESHKNNVLFVSVSKKKKKLQQKTIVLVSPQKEHFLELLDVDFITEYMKYLRYKA